MTKYGWMSKRALVDSGKSIVAHVVLGEHNLTDSHLCPQVVPQQVHVAQAILSHPVEIWATPTGEEVAVTFIADTPNTPGTIGLEFRGEVVRFLRFRDPPVYDPDPAHVKAFLLQHRR